MMPKQPNDIEFYLFKTNVPRYYNIYELSPYLNGIIETGEWHFDLEDCDNVLCLYCKPEIKTKVERTLRIKGFSIEELHYLESEVKE